MDKVYCRDCKHYSYVDREYGFSDWCEKTKTVSDSYLKPDGNVSYLSKPEQKNLLNNCQSFKKASIFKRVFRWL